MIEDDDAEETECFDTAAEAIEAAIHDLRKDGGGTLEIHREDCPGIEDCDCHPVAVWVEGSH